MADQPPIHRRRSIRLRHYDYAQCGAYFVTIVSQDRKCLFGDVRGAEMHLNPAGCMVSAVWHDLRRRFDRLVPDALVVMPNHIHGIVILLGKPIAPVPAGATTRVAPTSRAPLRAHQTVHTDVGGGSVVGAPPMGAPDVAPWLSPTLGDVVAAFKSLTTNEYIRGVKTLGWPRFRSRLWQRNYYEHVIRDDRSMEQLRDYIATNPAAWDADPENPSADVGSSG